MHASGREDGRWYAACVSDFKPLITVMAAPIIDNGRALDGCLDKTGSQMSSSHQCVRCCKTGVTSETWMTRGRL